MKKLIFFFSLVLMLSSCGDDDDICLSSDSTPRLKLKFKSQTNGKLIRLDSLYVEVDYGKNELTSVVQSANVDSVLIPLRVDDQPFTELYVRTAKAGDRSKIKIDYETKAIYVSPACGFKKNYENLNAELLESQPVLSIESNHSSLTNESKTNFYLHF